MPKMKTHRGAAKRFSYTKSGKLKRAKAYRNHMLMNKSSKQKRNLRKIGYATATEAKKMRVLLPYK